MGKMDKNSLLLALLIMLQPVLDILSYFAVDMGFTAITSALRLVIFGLLMVYAFLLSEKKKAYYIFAGVVGAYWIIHMILCARDGYSLVSDVNGFLRTVQMPALTLAFITLFKRAERFPDELGKFFCINYFIIGGSILLSYIVGMPVSTYATGAGIKGWFFTGNSQSYIISAMAMPALWYFYQKKCNWGFVLTMFVAFVQMYLFGTQVALYSIFIVAGVFLVILLWNREKRWVIAGALVIAVVATAVAIPCSPNRQQGAELDNTLHKWEDKLENQDKNPPTTPKPETHPLTGTILEDLVERFGYEKVLEVYGGEVDAAELMDNRLRKVNFGKLLMAEKDVWTWLFGCEDADMYFEGNTFDPENDFPALFFFYGIVGLALYVAFLGYFALLLCRDIFKSLRKLPVQKVIIAMTLVLSVGCAELSANVLRRPNASIYFSLLLAAAYYLCKVEKEPNYESEPDHSGI